MLECLKIIYLFQKSRRRPWTSIGRHLFLFQMIRIIKFKGTSDNSDYYRPDPVAEFRVLIDKLVDSLSEGLQLMRLTTF